MKVRVFLRRAACVVSFALLIRRAFLPTAGGSSLTAGIFLLIASPHSWKFSLARTPAHVPAVIEGEGFEGASAWGEIEVPMSLECAGHGQRQYTNFIYPFKCNPPKIADGVCVPTPLSWVSEPNPEPLNPDPQR